MKPKDNQSNQQNKNKGSSGTNKQSSQVQGNRERQKNLIKKENKIVYGL